MSDPEVPLSKQSFSTRRIIWNNSVKYTSCCVATTIGLGNIWRFPHIAYKNGGGAFVLIYLFIILIFGNALYYMEVVVGQFSSKKTTEIYQALAPGFVGIGWCQTAICIAISAYYGALTTYLAFYFLESYSSVLPWTVCKKEWGSNCITFSGNITNISGKQFSEELYFINEVLHQEDLSKGMFAPNPAMVVCSLLTWAITFVILLKSTLMTSKFSYFIAFCPYILILILMGRSASLEGASNGLINLFTPDWWKLFDPRVWYQAVAQSLFSLGQSIGVITTLASHNKFHYHAKTISGITVAIDTVTSLMFGVTHFAVLGHVDWKFNVTYVKAQLTTESVFVTYSQALSNITSIPNVFSILFFFVLFTVSIGSLVGLQMVIVSHLKYCFPTWKTWCFVTISTVVCFGLSTIYFTSGGYQLIYVASEFITDMVLCVLTAAIILAVFYCYGIQNLCWDIEYMSQKQIKPIRRIIWGIIDTAIIFFAVIYTFIRTNPAEIYSYPIVYPVCAWLLVCVIIMPLPAIKMYNLLKNRNKGQRETFTSENWRPYEESQYENWKRLKLQCQNKMDANNENFVITFLKVLLRMYD